MSSSTLALMPKKRSKDCRSARGVGSCVGDGGAEVDGFAEVLLRVGNCLLLSPGALNGTIVKSGVVEILENELRELAWEGKGRCVDLAEE